MTFLRTGFTKSFWTSDTFLPIPVTIIFHLFTDLSSLPVKKSDSLECQEIYLIMLSSLLNSAYQAVQAIDLGHWHYLGGVPSNREPPTSFFNVRQGNAWSHLRQCERKCGHHRNKFKVPPPGETFNLRPQRNYLNGKEKALMQSRIPGNVDLAMPMPPTVNSSHYYCNTCPSCASNCDASDTLRKKFEKYVYIVLKLTLWHARGVLLFKLMKQQHE